MKGDECDTASALQCRGYSRGAAPQRSDPCTKMIPGRFGGWLGGVHTAFVGRS
jgi:hypothetical protein